VRTALDRRFAINATPRRQRQRAGEQLVLAPGRAKTAPHSQARCGPHVVGDIRALQDNLARGPAQPGVLAHDIVGARHGRARHSHEKENRPEVPRQLQGRRPAARDGRRGDNAEGQQRKVEEI
jgi:hypothetical protein